MNDRNRPKKLIICGFPGVGKSEAVKYYNDDVSGMNRRNYRIKDMLFIDLESSDFDKSEFPKNYVDRIEEMYDENTPIIIFTSTHSSVLDELNKRKLPHIIVIPARGSKQEYIIRYIKRNDTIQFIKNVSYNWYKWRDDIISRNIREDNTLVIQIDKDKYLLDIIRNIL